MVFKRNPASCVMAAILLFLLPAAALSADVEIFAEGAYTAGDLEVYIYADINSGSLVSYGVKLTYDASKLGAPTAAKNEKKWYLGTAGSKRPYMNPEISNGQVVFIGGKLDTGAPTAGVSGKRVLLGKARFTRKESSMNLGTAAQSHFGISLALGRAAPYDNFVTTDGVVIDPDGVAFNSVDGVPLNKVRERGDANADGVITNLDMFTVRNLLGDSVYVPYADCNNDGVLTNLDMFCVRNKL